MRALWIAVLSLFLSVVAATADERPCDPGIGFAPSGGSLGTSSAVTWRAEPANTASRVVMVIDADGKSDAEQAKPGRHNLKLKRGTSTVVLVFYDAKGQVICTATTMVRGAGSAGGSSSGIAAGTDSLSSSGSASGEVAAAAPTVVVMGRYVVVFLGDTAYAGSPDKVNEWVPGDTYDGRAKDLTGFIGLEIYGNNQPNTIWGSDLDDIIHGGDETCNNGYGCILEPRLGDTIFGEAGNDRIFGGDERCGPQVCNIYGHAMGDVIDGGDGNDEIDGGDEFCFGYGCTSNSGRMGDDIYGGAGKDIIRGGNERCEGELCTVINTRTGDRIYGDGDDDTIFGGDETCDGAGCSGGAYLGDLIHGGDGDDSIQGGNESCTGTDCDQVPYQMGDEIHGDAGNDSIDGGSVGDDTVDGQPEP